MNPEKTIPAAAMPEEEQKKKEKNNIKTKRVYLIIKENDSGKKIVRLRLGFLIKPEKEEVREKKGTHSIFYLFFKQGSVGANQGGTNASLHQNMAGSKVEWTENSQS